MERAREAVAALAGAPFEARDVVLTSGGTEANNLALAHAFATPGGALVTSRIEHPSIVRAAEALADRGVVVVWVAPEASGRIAPEAVAEALDRAQQSAQVRLVTLQAVNHETGVVQPVDEVAAIVHDRGARLHVDAVQAMGRLDPATWRGADLLALAAHKLRGPKGIGALIPRPGITLRPLLFGGAQERGLRPGTQDAAAAAGFAVAAARSAEGPRRYAALAALRDRLEASLRTLGTPAPILNGEGTRAPHVANLPGRAGAATSSAPLSISKASPSPAAPRARPAPPSPPRCCWRWLASRGPPRPFGSLSARRQRPPTSTRPWSAGPASSPARLAETASFARMARLELSTGGG